MTKIVLLSLVSVLMGASTPPPTTPRAPRAIPSPTTPIIFARPTVVVESTKITSVIPSSIAYGNVQVNSQVEQTVLLSNNGNTPVVIFSISTNEAAFLAIGPATGTQLNPGQKAFINVVFTPTVAQDYNATLTISSNATTSPNVVSLSGTGVPSPTKFLAASPTTKNFGDVNISTFDDEIITLTNSGNAPVEISGITVSGSNTFTISGITFPTTIPPAGNTTFTVTYDPVTVGTHSANITVNSDADNAPTVVTVSGNGFTDPPTKLVNLTSNLNFGDVELNQTKAINATVTNVGTGNVSITNIGVTGTDYSFTPITLPTSILPGQQLNIAVRLQPTTAGSKTGTLTVTSDATGSPHTTDLSGNATAPLLVKAFPDAMGSGARATGGRGGTVHLVTNLNDSGAGSLRACVDAAGPRTCVFRVGGTIVLNSALNVWNGDLTVAGQSAPGGGIQISGKNITSYVVIIRSNNVIWRYTKIRKGFNANTPAQDGTPFYVFNGAYNVMVDHNSIAWTEDENITVWGSTLGTATQRDITFSNNIVAWPLNKHPTNSLTGCNTSNICDAMTNIDWIRNYFVNSSHRNPDIGNDSGRVVNNIIYNWSFMAIQHLGGASVDYIGNYFKNGPLTPSKHEILVPPAGVAVAASGNPSIYVSQNRSQFNTNPANDNWNNLVWSSSGYNGSEVGTLSTSFRRLSPLPDVGAPITTIPTNDLPTQLLPTVGASRRLNCDGDWVINRDSADTTVVNDFNNNTGVRPTAETDVGGFPVIAGGTACTDSDSDGIPNNYETAKGLNPNSSADQDDIAANGYSNLENYLNGANDAQPEPESPPVAFRGAMGGGALSVGGRGGVVIPVTNLNNSGPGSLRACVDTVGPRTCVFRVSGTIVLAAPLYVWNPFLTVAGQTAPGGGIQISGKTLNCEMLAVRATDVVWRYTKVRHGYNPNRPANCGGAFSMFENAERVMLDHNSIYWSNDDMVLLYSNVAGQMAKNITISNNIIAEGLAGQSTPLSVGASSASGNDVAVDIDIHRNLLTRFSHRGPMLANKRTRLVNNLIYAWNYWATTIQGGIDIDVIGNVWKLGPSSPSAASVHEFRVYPNSDQGGGTDTSPTIYITGNKGPNNVTPSNDNWPSMVRQINTVYGSIVESSLSTSYRRLTPLAAAGVPITAESATTIEATLTPIIGASRRLDCSGNWVSNRDAADTRVINDYNAGTGSGLVADEASVGGMPVIAASTPCADADLDGMPDAYETANGLNPNSASDRNGIAANGYTNLENYLNGPTQD